jgi:hypothetical protein
MFIEFDNEWRRYDGILVEEDVLCSFRVRTVRLGKYDDYASPACQSL